MARFYMTSVNSRGNTVSAMGRSSGQDAHLRGWNAGVEVVARVDSDDCDTFDIYMTGGSGGDGTRRLIGTVKDSDGPVFSLSPSPINEGVLS